MGYGKATREQLIMKEADNWVDGIEVFSHLGEMAAWQSEAAYQCEMIEAGHWPADVNPSCMDGEGDGK